MTVREMRYFNEVNKRVDLDPSLIRKKKPLARLIRASSKTMMMTILIIKWVSLSVLIRRNYTNDKTTAALLGNLNFYSVLFAIDR